MEFHDARTIAAYVRSVYKHAVRDSFYRNSLFLLVNMGFSTVTGFFFVIICAHLFSQQAFGYSTSLMGALGVATALSNLGMNRTMVRFLGRSENKSQDLVTKLLLTLGAAVLCGVGMSFFLRTFGIKHANSLTVVIFIATVLLMSVKNLFDNAFIAIRKSSGTLIESSLFSVTRLIFPIFVIGSGFIGIFSAQLAGAIVAIIVSVFLLTMKHGFEFRVKPSRESMEGKWQFAIGSYASDLIGGLPTSVLPIIVVAKLGPVPGALWYVAMQIINFLLMVSASINQAMFAEMANARGTITHFLKKASATMYGLLIPLAAAVFIFASFILRLFHGNYISAEHILRLMTIFALVGVANYITGSVLQLYRKVMYITVVNVLNAAVVIFYCLFFAHNLTGMALGWVYGEVVNFVLFVGGGIFVGVRHNFAMEDM